MIGCLRTRVRKQPIIALYCASENELKFYNLEARLIFLRGVVDNILTQLWNSPYSDGLKYVPG